MLIDSTTGHHNSTVTHCTRLWLAFLVSIQEGRALECTFLMLNSTSTYWHAYHKYTGSLQSVDTSIFWTLALSLQRGCTVMCLKLCKLFSSISCVNVMCGLLLWCISDSVPWKKPLCRLLPTGRLSGTAMVTTVEHTPGLEVPQVCASFTTYLHVTTCYSRNYIYQFKVKVLSVAYQARGVGSSLVCIDSI